MATNLVAATPTEQVMRCSSATRSRMQLADHGGRPEPAHGAGDVEEGLVEAQRLDQRGDRPEDLHDARGRPRRSGRGRAGATTACGHSRRARLIGIARVHAVARAPRRWPRAPRRGCPPPPTMTGRPRSSGRSTQLDRGEERVHVDVQDRAAGVVPGQALTGPGVADAVELAAAHVLTRCHLSHGAWAPQAPAAGRRAAARRPPRARDARWRPARVPAARPPASASPSTSAPGSRSVNSRTPCSGAHVHGLLVEERQQAGAVEPPRHRVGGARSGRAGSSRTRRRPRSGRRAPGPGAPRAAGRRGR